MEWYMLAVFAAAFAYTWFSAESRERAPAPERFPVDPSKMIPRHPTTRLIGDGEIIWLKTYPAKVRCEECGASWEMDGAGSIEREEVEHALRDVCNGRVVEA